MSQAETCTRIGQRKMKPYLLMRLFMLFTVMAEVETRTTWAAWLHTPPRVWQTVWQLAPYSPISQLSSAAAPAWRGIGSQCQCLSQHHRNAARAVPPPRSRSNAPPNVEQRNNATIGPRTSRPRHRPWAMAFWYQPLLGAELECTPFAVTPIHLGSRINK